MFSVENILKHVTVLKPSKMSKAEWLEARRAGCRINGIIRKGGRVLSIKAIGWECSRDFVES